MNQRALGASNTFMAQQALRFAENLTLPEVQVIVMRANMGCTHCRQRVSNIISKMNGLLDYMVDLRKREVIVRGVVDTKKKRKTTRVHTDHTDKKLLHCSCLYKLMCIGAC